MSSSITLNKTDGGYTSIQPENNGTSEIVTIPAGGIMPLNKMAFSVYASQTGTRPQVWTGYDTTTYDIRSFNFSGGSLNFQTGIWTVPKEGIYYMSVLYTPTTTDGFRALVKLFKNGDRWAEIIDQEPGDYYMSHDLSWSGLIDGVAGDQFWLSEENAPSADTGSVQWQVMYMGGGEL